MSTLAFVAVELWCGLAFSVLVVTAMYLLGYIEIVRRK